MVAILVPIFVCVVLPVSIVLIISLHGMKEDSNRTKVLLKAIEANNNIDADKLAESLKKSKKTAREILNLRLLRGCIFSFIGLALVGFSIVNQTCGSCFDEDTETPVMLFGGISFAVGLSYLIVWYVTRGQVDNADK